MSGLRIVGSCESCSKKSVCRLAQTREIYIGRVSSLLGQCDDLLEFESSCKEWDNGIREKETGAGYRGIYV